MSAGRRSMVLMAVFAACWTAVDALAARLTLPYSPYQVVFARYTVHLAILLLAFGWRAPGSLWRTQRPVEQIARSLLMLTMPASWILAARGGVDPGAALSIFWSCPLLMLGFARIVLRERVPAAAWVATAIGSGGAVLAHGGGRLPSAWLAAFPVAMAASFSLYVAMTRSLRSESTPANLFYTAFGVAAALAFVQPRVWLSPPPHDVLVLVAVGTVGLVGLWALDRMAAAAPLAASAPWASVQVACVLALEWPGLRAHAKWRTGAGLALVAGAALCAWVREPSLTKQRNLVVAEPST